MTFFWKGDEYEYFDHPYNQTATNERSAEVPIVMSLVEAYKGQRILEVGNVLNHYGALPRTVVDRHEKGEGVLNEDIEAFMPESAFDLIVSISTLEHVGWNEGKYGKSEAPDDGKLSYVIDRLKAMSKGRFLTTMPIGYNPPMDSRIRDDELGLDASYMVRTAPMCWREADRNEAMSQKYGPVGANGLFIGEWHDA
jgi:hypothetical protein